ncbi:MAG: hypothetical protein WDW38_002282 [Sanguina aurantia]
MSRTSTRVEPGSFSLGNADIAKKTSQEVLSALLQNNKEWASAVAETDVGHFQRLQQQHTPFYMWIGCADARVPANIILGLEAGEVFTQRNVGNQACHSDLNCMSCLEYAVKVLKVTHIIVCGHYSCGAVRAALTMPSGAQGLVNCWISDIRNCRNTHAAELKALPTMDAQADRLCELNVLRQTFNVCTSPVVQEAWANGVELVVHGLVYSLKDGLLRQLVGPLARDSDFAHDLTDFEGDATALELRSQDASRDSGDSFDSRDGDGGAKKTGERGVAVSAMDTDAKRTGERGVALLPLTREPLDGAGAVPLPHAPPNSPAESHLTPAPAPWSRSVDNPRVARLRGEARSTARDTTLVAKLIGEHTSWQPTLRSTEETTEAQASKLLQPPKRAATGAHAGVLLEL